MPTEGITGQVDGFHPLELRHGIDACRWTHRINLGNGLFTNGVISVESQASIKRAFDDIDFQGKKVLDIGCWDGLWSFEAERRGAREVYATDAISQRPFAKDPSLLLAREILGSRIKYYPRLRVQEITDLGIFDFDVVVFAGVYYHLKDPLLAFAKLRRVMKEGALIIVEGEVIDAPGCYAEFYYVEHYADDRSNWWIPTVSCLRQWVECSFLEILTEYPEPPGHRRRVLTARAVRRNDPHYVFEDPDLPADCFR